MTAIISGNGLGLFNSSLNQLGGSLGSHPGLGQSQTSQYVNVATGNLLMHGEDERLLGRSGLLVDVSRTYNSRGVLASSDAAGVDLWTFSFENTVQLVAGTVNTAGSVVERVLGDGTRIAFAFDATSGVYRSTAGDGAHDTISYDPSRTEWTWTEGSTLRQEVYDAAKRGLLSLVRDTKTGAENRFERNASGLLERIVTQTGDAVVFGYNGSGQQLLSVSTLENGQTRSQVRYGYDGYGRLFRIEVDLTPGTWADNDLDATKSFVTEYEYADDTPRIKRASRGMAQSDGVEVSYEYYTDGPNRDKVRLVTIGNALEGSAQTLYFAYDAANRSTDVTDEAGQTWTYRYDAAGQLTDILSPAENGLRQLTHIEYNLAGDVTRVVDAEGRATTYEYDPNGNCILQRDSAGNTVRRTFDVRNQLVTQAAYQVADPDGAGAGEPDGAMVTRYVHDERGRVVFQLDPQGEVTQFQYDALTGQVSARLRYITDRCPVAGLAENQVPGRATMEAWVGGVLSSGNGAGGSLSRTDFLYDASGHRARQIAYAKVDAAGLGILDAEAEVTELVYDAQGLLVEQITYRGTDRQLAEWTSHTYDGLGRLLSSRDAAGNLTTRLYDDAGQRLVVVLANGLVRTETLDKAGRTIAVTESAAGTPVTRSEHRYYDRSGRLSAMEDANGGRTYYFYDAANRLAGEVDVTGAVTEYRRDRTGRVLETRRYLTRVDTRAWLVGRTVQPQRMADIRPASAAGDRVTFATYDAGGRLFTETDGEGTVTTYGYDGASRLVRISVASPQDPGIEPRMTRRFYDDSGRTVATLDAEGYLIEHRFDAAGRELATIRYARATAAALRADVWKTTSIDV